MSLARMTETLDLFRPKYLEPANQGSTNAYVDMAKIDTEGRTRVGYIIRNVHAANSIDWKVLASNDDVLYTELKAEAALAAVTTVAWANTGTAGNECYRYYKLQIKSTVAETAGTVQARVYAKM